MQIDLAEGLDASFADVGVEGMECLRCGRVLRVRLSCLCEQIAVGVGFCDGVEGLLDPGFGDGESDAIWLGFGKGVGEVVLGVRFVLGCGGVVNAVVAFFADLLFAVGEGGDKGGEDGLVGGRCLPAVWVVVQELVKEFQLVGGVFLAGGGLQGLAVCGELDSLAWQAAADAEGASGETEVVTAGHHGGSLERLGAV